MISIIAHLYALVCLATIGFQIALIAGAPWGAYTQGGFDTGALPVKGRVVATVSILILIGMGVAILSVAGGFGFDWPRWTGWVALGIQALSCLLNWITPSIPERRFWGPVTSVQTALALVVMIA